MWRCVRYRKLLMPFSEGALSPDKAERLNRHLDVCESCRDELTEIMMTVEALRGADIPPMEPAPDLWSGVRDRIEARPAAASFWRTRSLQAASAAVVGTVLLLFVLVRPAFQPMPEQGTERYAVTPPRAPGAASVRKGRSVTPSPPGETKLRSAPELRFGSEERTAAKLQPRLPSPASPAPALEMAPTTPVYPDYRQNQNTPGGAQTQQPTSQYFYSGPPATGSKAAPAPLSAKLGGFATETDSQRNEELFKSEAFDSSGVTPLARAGASEVGSAAKPPPAALALSQKIAALKSRRLAYMRQLREKPDDTSVIQSLAEVERELGYKAAVVLRTKKLTEMRPKDSAHWLALGEAYEVNRQPEQASTAYRRAIDLGLPAATAAEVEGRIQKLPTNLKRRG